MGSGAYSRQRQKTLVGSGGTVGGDRLVAIDPKRGGHKRPHLGQRADLARGTGLDENVSDRRRLRRSGENRQTGEVGGQLA